MDQPFRNITDVELVSRLEDLVRSERGTTADIVMHLAEVDARQLYNTCGYSSLFDYAVRGLGYARAAAMRRIKAARAGAKAPKLFDYLREGETTLHAVDVFAEFIGRAEGSVQIEEIRGKSREDAEKLVAHLRPVEPSAVRDRIKPIVVARRCDVRQAGFELGGKPAEVITEENSNKFQPGTEIELQLAPPETKNEPGKIIHRKQRFVEKLKRAQVWSFAGE